MPELLHALETCMRVHHLDGLTDYRERCHQDSLDTTLSGDFIVPVEDSSAPCTKGQEKISSAFAEAVGNQPVGPQKLSVAWGRTLECTETAPGIAKFDFEELCGVPLSAED